MNCTTQDDQRLQAAREMHLARDLDKTAGRISVLSDSILRHSFDDGVFESLLAEVLERPLNEPATQTAASKFSRHREVWDSTLTSLGIYARRDIADYTALRFGNKNSGGISRGILIELAGFAPAPIVMIESSECHFQVLFDGHPVEAFQGQGFDGIQVSCLKQAQANVDHTKFED